MANEINILQIFPWKKCRKRTAAINKQKGDSGQQELKYNKRVQGLGSLVSSAICQRAKQRHWRRFTLRTAIQMQFNRAFQRFRRHFPTVCDVSQTAMWFRAILSCVPENTEQRVQGSKITRCCRLHRSWEFAGAMMSVMGINTLTSSLVKVNYRPGTIMNLLDRNVNHVFASEIEERKYCQMAWMCRFYFRPATYKLEYCIAKFHSF